MEKRWSCAIVDIGDDPFVYGVLLLLLVVAMEVVELKRVESTRCWC